MFLFSHLLISIFAVWSEACEAFLWKMDRYARRTLNPPNFSSQLVFFIRSDYVLPECNFKFIFVYPECFARLICSSLSGLEVVVGRSHVNHHWM